MVVWKVTCRWYEVNDYSLYENDPTEIGIFTSMPLAARAAINFIECMNRRRSSHYLRVVSEVWNDSINISEYDLSDGSTYDFANIWFEEVTLNSGLTY